MGARACQVVFLFYLPYFFLYAASGQKESLRAALLVSESVCWMLRIGLGKSNIGHGENALRMRVLFISSRHPRRWRHRFLWIADIGVAHMTAGAKALYGQTMYARGRS